nr:MAG TPA: hypothetical protein [Caudoviricetes sp.]
MIIGFLLGYSLPIITLRQCSFRCGEAQRRARE